jgi:2-deoxy-D-gluconate 3-dehydrogenase
MNIDARDNAETVGKRVPSGRVGDEKDMGGAAIFLASRAGDYVVGSTITVDGGIAFGKAGFDGATWKD